MSNISPVLSVRVSPGERDILEVAAGQARTNLSDFVRRKALEAAEIDILQYGVVTIAAADWDRFEAWVEMPGREVPALQELANCRPAWQD